MAVVGFWVVAQQIPRAVTVAPPSYVIFPPDVAELEVITDAEVVASRVGTNVWANPVSKEDPAFTLNSPLIVIPCSELTIRVALLATVTFSRLTVQPANVVLIKYV